MKTHYSVYKIFKNKFGGFCMILAVVAIIILPVSLFFVKDLSVKISLLFYSSIILLWLIPYLLITIGKINYFFKHGIEAKALIVDDNFALPPDHYFSVFLVNKILSPWNDVNKYKKDGVVYKYKVGSEIYEGKYRFIVNGDTMPIKENSVVNILVNPKNKNDSIIKDIFIR
jgi:hypothetical protein